MYMYLYIYKYLVFNNKKHHIVAIILMASWLFSGVVCILHHTLQTLLTSADPVSTSVCSLGRIWHSGETPLSPVPGATWTPSFFWCFLPVRCGELPWFGALGGLSTEKWAPILKNRDEQLQDICHRANLKRYISTCCIIIIIITLNCLRECNSNFKFETLAFPKFQDGFTLHRKQTQTLHAITGIT